MTLLTRVTFRLYNKLLMLICSSIVYGVYLGNSFSSVFEKWGLYLIVYTGIGCIVLVWSNSTDKLSQSEQRVELTTPTPIKTIKRKAKNYKSVLEALPDGILMFD